MTQKLPYFPFYIGDWRKDLGIKALNLELRGLWLEMLFDMWESEQRGKLLINGENPSDEILAEFYKISPKKFKKMKEKLLFLGVASIDEKMKCLYSRRMVKDEKIRVIRSEAGKKGGNPALKGSVLVEDLLNQKANQIPDNENDIETDTKALTNKEAFKKGKQEAFDKRWIDYPGKKDDRRKANKSWESSIKKMGDIENYDLAVKSYIADVRYDRNNGFPDLNFKYGTTWFKNWRASIPAPPVQEVYIPPELPKPRIPGNPVLEKFWNDAREKIRSQVQEDTFEASFKSTYPKRLSSGVLTIAVPNQYCRKCLIENYRGLIESSLSEIRGSPILADFVIERG